MFPADTWERGLEWPAFRRDRIRENADAFDSDFREPAFRPAERDVLARLPPLRVVAVGEDWCPDVYHTLGTWARLADELPHWELRIFARDEHPDVMDRYLWLRDRRRIPVYAFHDEDLRPLAWWSGRSAAAQDAVDDVLDGASYADATDAQRERLRSVFAERYRTEFRRANFREVFHLLMDFFHLRPDSAP